MEPVFKFSRHINNRKNLSGAHGSRRLVLKAGVAALAGALLVGCSGGNTPEGVAKAYVTAIFEGKVDEALAMTINGESLGPKVRSILASAPAQAAKHGGFKSVEVTSSEVKGDTATVNMTIHYQDGSSEDSGKRGLKLVRVDGKWKVVIR